VCKGVADRRRACAGFYTNGARRKNLQARAFCFPPVAQWRRQYMMMG